MKRERKQQRDAARREVERERIKSEVFAALTAEYPKMTEQVKQDIYHQGWE